MKITILSGAGLSAESGLGTFRDKGGVWTQYDLNDVATPEGFARDPDLVHAFYNARRRNCLDAAPNPAHVALSKLQKDKSFEVTLITQNIDDLLERAGATDVIHMHGELMRGRCHSCAATWDVSGDMATSAPCPRCGAPSTRPDVVWFGEIPYDMDRCIDAVTGCDLFVALGTSAEVYPAAGFVDLAQEAGAKTLELNLAPSGRAGVFDQVRLGPASEAVPTWVDGLLNG